MRTPTAEQRAWIDGLSGTFDRYWEFDWGGVGYVERDGVMWAMWAGIEGAYDADGAWAGPRIQIIDVSSDPERIVADLDAGSDPEDSWEDGMGHMVCRENAAVCDADGEPLRYMVEDEKTEGSHETFVTYHDTLGGANSEAMNRWLHLTPRERKTRRIHVCYINGYDIPSEQSLYTSSYCWDSDALPSEEDEEDKLDEITVISRVVAGGGSLHINLTKEFREMGLDRGDRVEVTLRRI